MANIIVVDQSNQYIPHPPCPDFEGMNLASFLLTVILTITNISGNQTTNNLAITISRSDGKPNEVINVPYSPKMTANDIKAYVQERATQLNSGISNFQGGLSGLIGTTYQ